MVITPRSMPKLSLSTLAIGARQLVVHDAFEIDRLRRRSSRSSLTPSTTVMSSPLAGAEMITFLAPPSTCFRALSALVNNPVDSMTMSTPRSFHGSWPGPLGQAGSCGPRRSRPVRPDLGQPAEDAVVLQQVGDRLGVGEVVVADDLDVVPARRGSPGSSSARSGRSR